MARCRGGCCRRVDSGRADRVWTGGNARTPGSVSRDPDRAVAGDVRRRDARVVERIQSREAVCTGRAMAVRRDHCDARRRVVPGWMDAGADPARVGWGRFVAAAEDLRPSGSWTKGNGGHARMSVALVYLLLLKATVTSFAGMGSLP